MMMKGTIMTEQQALKIATKKDSHTASTSATTQSRNSAN